MPIEPDAARTTATVEYPDEFRAYLEYLELADPEAYAVFQRQADVTLP